MKILFICGSLEPGKDGVGDYTRRLAGELTRKGNEVRILALKDRYIKKAIKGKQASEDVNLAVFRLPFEHKISEKVQAWVNSFKPTHISLQYVSYSFHDRGLHRGLARELVKLGESCKWHIMFHELWLMKQDHSKLNEKFTGWLQKRMIKKLITIINPSFVTTHSLFYKQELVKLGVPVERLPLFSNIPYLKKTINSESVSSNIKFVVFGTIHPNSLFEKFASEAKEYQSRHGVLIELTILGRYHKKQEEWKRIWNQNSLKLHFPGESDSENISRELSRASIGLSTTSIPKIEKSGSVVAMREHGLQVICLAETWNDLEVSTSATSSDIINYKENEFITCIEKGLKKNKPYSGIEKIAERFQGLLQQC